MATSLSEVFEFLDIAEKKNFINTNTVLARRTACNKLFDILDEDQKTVEYVSDNIDVIKTRFSNRFREVTGKTVEEYARRAQLVLNDFSAWKVDRAAWERDVAARQSARPAAGDADRKTRGANRQEREKPKVGGGGNGAQTEDAEVRVVKFPIRPDFDVTVTLPRSGITVPELKKLVYFLLPYAPDWEPTEAPRNVFPMLESGAQETRR